MGGDCRIQTPTGGPGTSLLRPGFLAIAAYFLGIEHRAHVVQFLPYASCCYARCCTFSMLACFSGRPWLRWVMFPILVTMYVKLARREEEEVLAEFGEEYRRYMDATPAFFPNLSRGSAHKQA